VGSRYCWLQVLLGVSTVGVVTIGCRYIPLGIDTVWTLTWVQVISMKDLKDQVHCTTGTVITRVPLLSKCASSPPPYLQRVVYMCIHVRALIVVMYCFHVVITCSNVNRAWCSGRAVCVGHAVPCCDMLHVNTT